MMEVAPLTRPFNSAKEDSSTSISERLSVAISNRLSSIKEENRSELEKLALEKESLLREVDELKQARDIFEEESAALNKRNTELAEETSEAQKKLDSIKSELAQVQKLLLATSTASKASLPPRSTSALSASTTSHVSHESSASTLVASSNGHSAPMASAQSSASDRTQISLPQKHSLPPPPIDEQPQAFVAAAQKVEHVAPQATARKFKYVEQTYMRAQGTCVAVAEHSSLDSCAPSADGEARKASNDRRMPHFRSHRCSQGHMPFQRLPIGSTTGRRPVYFGPSDARAVVTRCVNVIFLFIDISQLIAHPLRS